MSYVRPLFSTGSGAQGPRGAEGVAGGAGIILYYNYSVTGSSPYALQRTIGGVPTTVSYAGGTTINPEIVSWKLNPVVSTPFTFSGGTYQSVIYASGTGTIQIINITDATTTQIAQNSNTVTVSTGGTTPYILLGIINTGPINLTTNNYIQLQFSITGTVTITYQSPTAYSNLNLITPIFVQGQTGPRGYTGVTGAQGFQGPQGATGVTGSQGPVGTTGVTGADGFTGATGAQGTTGAQGPSFLTVGYGPTGNTAGATAYSNINTIIFDSTSDFSVSKNTPNVAFVSMNSTFKYWQANGNTASGAFLTANGVDTVNFVGATGISISMDPTKSPKQVIIGLTGAAGQSYWTQTGNQLYPTTITNNVGIGTTGSSSYALDVNGNVNVTGTIKFANTTSQNTAYTGATAGVYTNVNMTIDANGKISVISSGTAGSRPKPYFWATGTGITQQYPTTINILNSTFGNWNINMFYTLRLNLTVSYASGASVFTFDTMIDIYPKRINSSSMAPLSTQTNNIATNSINGNTNFSMTDPTYAPSGRWFWSHQITATGTMGTGWVQIHTFSGGGIGVQIVNPNGKSSGGAFSVNIMTEIVSQGAGYGLFVFENLDVSADSYQYVGSG